jgi:Xaa-Pro aminopeptidase
MSDHPLSTEKIRSFLRRKAADAFLVDSIKNVRYLTGFTGSSAFVLLTRERGLFFTDFRYQEQARSEVRGWEIMMERGKRIDTLRKTALNLGVRSLGFETSVSFEFYSELKRLRMNLIPVKRLVESLRKIKSDLELSRIREAVRRAEQAFLRTVPFVRVGAREQALALRLEEFLRKEGCRHAAFDIIVASGKNSSMPHAKTTDKKIEKGDFVIIDWGGEADGYYSDMTRTLLAEGPALSEKKNIYEVVNSAREKALAAVTVGIPARDIDGLARRTIGKAGYGELFGHATGHGVGLDVHEAPRISWTNAERLGEGMVFTIEPGIYKPGLGGVRIEDMVVLSGGKALLMTSLPRDLAIIRS